MKKKILFFGLLALALLAAGPALHAEEDDMAGGRAKQKLGLTDEQVPKFREELKLHRQNIKLLREKLKGLMDILDDEVKAADGDEKVQASLTDIETVQKDIDVERQRDVDAFKAILKPTQQAKMLLFMRAALVRQMAH
jgi:Spy/CpxP family protein refolding chaperone